jgi:Cft2 family RNA processing exonuclease
MNCQHSLHGRADKKFCNDYCRNTFSNRQNQAQNKVIRNITGALKRNRNIINDMIGLKPGCIVTRTDMLNAGFHFYYFTHIKSNSRNITTYFCFDYGYQVISDDTIKLYKS